MTYLLDGTLGLESLPGGGVEGSLADDPVTGQILASENTLGQFSFAGLDGEGNIIASTGGGGIPTGYQYDPTTGLLVEINTSQGGSLASGTDGTIYAYDANGNLTSITYADDSQEVFTYLGDMLTGITLPGGVSITEGFDSEGRNNGYSATDGTNTVSSTETLNDQGLATSISDTDASGTYTRSLTYNNDEQLTSEGSGVLSGISTGYAYDDAGNQTSTTLKSGSSALATQAYTYDAEGRLFTLTVGDQTFTYSYDSDTELLGSITSTSGVTTTYAYDSDTQDLTGITVTKGGATLYSATYGYNGNDQIISANSTTGNWTFGYDSEGQLKSAGSTINGISAASQQYSYAYDQAGNRTNLGDVNDLNQYASDTYDARGNLTDDGTNTYAYDPMAHLLSVTPDDPAVGTLKTTFTYDEQGRRTSKTTFAWDVTADSGAGDWSTTPTNHIKFAYEGSNLIAEFNVTFDGSTEVDTLAKTYSWGASGLQSITIYNTAGDTVLRTLIPLADASGNIVMLVNSSDGSVGATYLYDPYGKLIGHTGNWQDSEFQFKGQTGAYTDESTGLVLMGVRYESPVEGRFITQDPSGQDGGVNLYRFADNDPVNESDPTGLNPIVLAPILVSEAAAGPVGWAAAGVTAIVIGGVLVYQHYYPPVVIHRPNGADLRYQHRLNREGSSQGLPRVRGADAGVPRIHHLRTPKPIPIQVDKDQDGNGGAGKPPILDYRPPAPDSPPPETPSWLKWAVGALAALASLLTPKPANSPGPPTSAPSAPPAPPATGPASRQSGSTLPSN